MNVRRLFFVYSYEESGRCPQSQGKIWADIVK